MSTSSERTRYWSVIRPMPAREVTATVQMMEAVGIDGLFAPQVLGPLWIPLAAAAAVSERVLLGSGVAIAAARSPFETAVAALDMDRLSGGRLFFLDPRMRCEGDRMHAYSAADRRNTPFVLPSIGQQRKT